MILAIYLGAFAFGGVLVGASALLGGEDLDHDADIDLDADMDADLEGDVAHAMHAESGGKGSPDDADVHDGDGSELAWLFLPLLSLRFWSFGAAAFGATGTLMTMFGQGPAFSLPVAIVFGWAAGAGAAWLFRNLRSQIVSGGTTLDRYVGQEGVVLLAIRAGRRGTVRVGSSAGDLVLPAITGDKKDIPAGAVVLIASIKDGTADVTRLQGAAVPGVA